MKTLWISIIFVISLAIVSIMVNPVNSFPDRIDWAIALFHLPGLFLSFFLTYIGLKKHLTPFLLFPLSIFIGYLTNFLLVDYFDFSRFTQLYFVSPFENLEQILLLLPYSLLGFIHFGVEEHFEKQRLELEIQRIKQIEQELREGLLKSQIQPHFLFNALNTIFVMSRKNHPDTSSAVLELSELLRYTVDSLKKKSVQIENEFHFLQNYCSFQKKRLSGNLDLKLDFVAENTAFLISPLLFQPIVENAFNYVQINTLELFFIHLKIHQSDKEILFDCQNSIEPSQVYSNNEALRTGLGIDLVKKRLEIEFPNHFDFSVHTTDTNFHVQIKLVL